MPRNISDDDPRKRAAKDFDRKMRRQAILTWTARGLMAFGLFIAGQHLFAHAGYRPIPMPMPAQDLFIGYPTAAVVFMVGLIIWGRNPLK